MEKLLKYRMTAPPDIFDIPVRPPEQAYVFMYAEHFDDDSLIQFEGPERLVRDLKRRVYGSYGFRARMIDEYTAPRDLICAMQGWQLAPYKPEMLEGEVFFAKPEENA